MDFFYLWLGALVLFYLCVALFEIWYKRYDGFIDWWYHEINKKPGAGDWYYRRRQR